MDENPELPSSTRVVRSFHSFDHLPDDLPGLFRKLERRGGDVVKIAVKVSATRELVRLLSWMESLPAEKPYIVLEWVTWDNRLAPWGPFLGTSGPS